VKFIEETLTADNNRLKIASRGTRLELTRQPARLSPQKLARKPFGMAISKDEAVEKARKDLAQRLNVDANTIKQQSVEDSDFPDMALGAGEDGEMSGQMITRGWRIRLDASGKSFEYRADKNQVRLYKYKGKNYRI
jgi:hypothetical protein